MSGEAVSNGQWTIRHSPSGIFLRQLNDEYALRGFRANPFGILDASCRAIFSSATSTYVTLFSAKDSAGLFPRLYFEWIYPHIDSGHWIRAGQRSAPVEYREQPILKASDNVPLGDVTCSFAVDAHYAWRMTGESGFCFLNNRIDGLSGTLDVGILKQGTWYRDPSVCPVCPLDPANTSSAIGYQALAGLGYDVAGLRYKFPPGKALPIDAGPHLRFRPPWWPETSATLTIACVGDSLTSSWPCGTTAATEAYPSLLQAYLAQVGVQASVSNYGIGGAVMWRGSPGLTGNGPVNYQNLGTSGAIANDPRWYGNAKQPQFDLVIIWLGTNDVGHLAPRLNQSTDAGLYTQQLMEDFERIMRFRAAGHYLLVKIDGPRAGAGARACRDDRGNIDLATCPRSQENAVACVNGAMLALEQKYHNVHVAEVDYSTDRCVGGEVSVPGPGTEYTHFGTYEGVAKSIFGRIMCHAVFHRPTGDLRWVGAVPNAKMGDTVLPTLTTLAAAR
jgi:lysophospholipase L1-like esterase